MKTICTLNGKIVMSQDGDALIAMQLNASQHSGAVASVVSDADYLTLLASQPMTAAELKDKVSAKRYLVEVAGINFTYRTMQVPISTSRDSQAKIDAARNMVKDTVWVDNSNWKCLDGKFRPLTNAEVLDMVAAVRTHIKATYDVEATKFAEIDATGTTDVDTGWPATANAQTTVYFNK